MYELNDFNNVILFVWNRGFDEFVKMYDAIGFHGQNYAEEKFHKAQTNFGGWWLDIDKFYQERIIEYVKNFYGVKND